MYNNFTVVTLTERPDLFEAADTMCGAEWPEFMLHDPVANDNWMTFIEAYPEFQLLILHGDDIAAVVTPSRWDRDFAEHYARLRTILTTNATTAEIVQARSAARDEDREMVRRLLSRGFDG